METINETEEQVETINETEEQVETINVLIQKRPHHLLVNHIMNVRLALPPVETSMQTRRRSRVDVAVETSLHTNVASGVLCLLVFAHLPIGLIVVG